MAYRGGRPYGSYGGYTDRFATDDPLAAAIQGALSGGLGMFETVRGVRQENADRAERIAEREAAAQRQAMLDARDESRWNYGVSRDAQARQDALDAEKRQREQKVGDRLTARGVSVVPVPNAGGGFGTAYAKVGPSEQEEAATLEYAIKQKFAMDELRGQAKALGVKGAEGMSLGELQQVVADAADTKKRTADFQDFAKKTTFAEGVRGARGGAGGDGGVGARAAAGMPQDPKDETTLRKEYTQQVGRHEAIASGLAKIRASAQLGTGQGDMGIIFGFMKMQDPNSSVREGEYATAENTQGVPDQVRMMYNKALTGEKLADGVRQQFVQAAESLGETEHASAVQAMQRYAGIAQQYGMRADRIVYDPYAAVFNTDMANRGRKPGERPPLSSYGGSRR